MKNSTLRAIVRVAAVSAIALVLQACGGGGGGGGSSAASGQPSISSFTAGAAIITTGSSVSLTAVFANGTGVIDNGAGSVTSGSPVLVTPAVTTIYTLTVTNTAGTSVTSTVTVTVVPPPSITSFTSDAAIITAGSSVSLTAVFANGTGVIDNGVGSVTSSSPVSVMPATPTTYTLTVTNAAGTSVTSSVAVNVVGLDSLTTTAAAPDQLFQPVQSNYTATVGFLAQSVRIMATTATTSATVTVDGVTLGADNTSQLITLSEGGNPAITIVVTALSVSKTYTLILTRKTAADFAQQAYAKASNTDAGDNFGYSVAVSGDTLAVGAFQENSSATGINGDQTDNSIPKSGAVYIFTRNGGTWTQQAYIKASRIGNLSFGLRVALSGNTLAVGANPGYGVFVFTRTGTTWSQQALIENPNTGANNKFGNSIALSGDTLAIGANWDASNATGINGDQTDNSAIQSGAVYVFTRNGGIWSQQAYIKASNTDAYDFFGESVALSGDTLAVGAYWEDSNATGIDGNQADNSISSSYSGAVYVFTRSGGTWSQQAYIKASNTGLYDSFGYSVSLSGDTLAVGAYGEASNATGIDGNQTDDSSANSGAVYVFTRTGTTWSQQAYIKASNTESNDRFGFSVALSEDTLAVCAFTEGSNTIGIDGNQADNSAPYAGAVYVFTRSGTTWSQQFYVKASNTETDDFFGRYIALSGDTLVVGAHDEDSNAAGINGDETDNSAGSSGAVYVFE